MKNILTCFGVCILYTTVAFGQMSLSFHTQTNDSVVADPGKAYGWNWLYTGVWGAGSNTNIGLDGAGTWYAGIILNLSAHIGDSITKIGYYHGDSATVTAKVYTGNYQNPLVLVGQSDPYTFTTPGWKQNILLQTPVGISSPSLYWIVLEIQDPGEDYYPLGSRTPLNTNAGKISLNGTTWTDLSTYSLNFSWLIGAFVYSVCPPPKNLNVSVVTANSATIHWVSQGSTTFWEIQYGPSGFVPGTGLTATSTATITTLQNLNHSTLYDFYVRARCGVADSSDWVGPVSFETEYVNDNADFLSYYFGFGGEIDNMNDPNINITIPSSPDLSNLIAHFTVSQGVREVKVGNVDQISGQTPNNFYTPVVYSIMAEDSVTIKNWMIIVNGYNDITAAEVDKICIFPNPCSDHFLVYHCENCQLLLIDQTGKTVISKRINQPVATIHTSHLAKGIYTLKINDNERIITSKVMVY